MEITEELFVYMEGHIDPEPEELHRLDRESHLRMVHGRMCSGHHQGRLLKMLTMMIRPRRVLELGTFTGYSALCIAEGMREIFDESEEKEFSDTKSAAGRIFDESGEKRNGDLRIDTIEIFDENEDFIRRALERSPHGGIVNLIIGDALEVMPTLAACGYDLIFIDADKRGYPEYYRQCKRLLKRGGYIIADNTLWDGHVTERDRHDPQTAGVKRFNEMVRDDMEVEKIIIPLRDGLTIIRKR